MKKLIYTLAFILFVHCSLSINNCKAQWVQVWNGMGQTATIVDLEWNGSLILAGLVWTWTSSEKGVYISTNEGLTWGVTSLDNKDIWDITSTGSNNYACGDNGIYVSNNGTNWASFALSNRRAYCLAISGNYMYAGTDNYGVYYSTNSGSTWTQSFLNNKDIWSIAVHNNYVIAGTNGNGIYYSSDNGYVWNQSHINNIDVESIRFDGTTAYAGTEDGVYKSTNFGANWVQFGLSGKNIDDIQFYGPYIYVGTDYDGVYVSTKQGSMWNKINNGFLPGDININSLVFTNNYFVAGLYKKSAWRRPKSQVSIKYISGQVTSSFSLEQNYPNPFNPVTNIKFNLPKTSETKLIVYDALGREVAILVNERLSAGSYEVNWNASEYSSGVYFCKLISNEFSKTIKLTLVK